jgi:anti-anti-sigma regulatory factor
MAILDSTHGDLEIRPERERVCLRVVSALDHATLKQLEEEALALMERGFARVAIDLRGVETAAPAAAATLAAINRHARRCRVELVLIPGRSGVVGELIEAGLLSGVAIEETSVRAFFDWSR